MTVFRINKTQNYSVISNKFLNDDNLSWKAKGILTWLLSRQDGWKPLLIDMQQRSKDGRDSTAAGINELVDYGYIVRHKIRDDKGLLKGYEYQVYEESVNGLSVTENPNTEKPTLISTDKVNTNKVSTKQLNILTEVINHFNLKTNKTKYQKGSERATLEKYINAMVKNGDTLEAIKNLIDYKLANPNTQKTDLLSWLNTQYVGQNMANANEWLSDNKPNAAKFTNGKPESKLHRANSQNFTDEVF